MTEDNLYLLFCYLIYGVTLLFLTIKSKNRIKVLSINLTILIIYSSYFLYNLKNNSQGGSGLLWLVGLISIIGIHWLTNLIGIFIDRTQKSKSISNLSALISILLVTTSCNKSTPAGFWKDYHKEKITNNISDQGPSGGHRNIIWKSKALQTFNSKDIIEFATKNGWTFIDSNYISTDTIKSVTQDENMSIEYWEDILRTDVLPKWKAQRVLVLKFKTGWIAVEPGNLKETEINGFATLNADKTVLNIYHKWGE